MRALSLFSLLFLVACSGEMGPDPVTENPGIIIHQKSGCLANAEQVQTVFADTCFDYSFDDTLKMDFCFTGNCCPDTNRFTGVVEVTGQTITIAVTDTAENLCHCVCPYQVHVEISGLSKSAYTVICSDGNLNYLENVTRNY